jgi:cytochrome oxidase assembly protein ShyY1
VLRTLRQPRYAALSVLMLVVALACIAAGTWQIARFEGKVGANDELRTNAHARIAPVGEVLPLVQQGATPKRDSIELRQVSVTGSYQADRQVMVRQVSLDGSNGYWVLTPLRTADATLLVVRGFVAMTGSGSPPTNLPAPPAGPVHLVARVQPGDTRTDNFGRIPAGQVDSVNPRQQAMRLGGPVYDGFVQLEPGQPGTNGVTAIPAPDLSNPAGGALEPQHLAYVVQWYIFAALALAAPFVMARAETRHQPTGEFDADGDGEPEPQLTPEEQRAAKLAARYGRAVR